MECLDQLNSNLLPTDRASTAALGPRCPACDNQNVVGSNTDNGRPASGPLITSPSTRLHPDCSCLPLPPSPNRQPSSSPPPHLTTSQQTVVASTERPMSSSPQSSSTITTSLSPSPKTNPSSMSERSDPRNPSGCLSPPASSQTTTVSHTKDHHKVNPEWSSTFQSRRSSINANTMDQSSSALSSGLDQVHDSNPPSVHHHSPSKPIPIAQSSHHHQQHRLRHHNDSDLTLGSLTPSAHARIFSKASWGTGISSGFGSSGPEGNLSPLYLFNQQSPKYFKLPSSPVTTITPPTSSGCNRVPIHQADTTPKVFDQWPSKTLTASSVSPQSQSKKDLRPSSSPRQRPSHRSRWKSRVDEDADVTMTPLDGSKSDPGYGSIDPDQRPLPKELIHQLHELEHYNEDLSADVVFALQDKGFVIHEVLGKGISSVVRRVTEKKSGQDFAVKIIDISGEKGDLDVVEQTKRDTIREIQILRQCGMHDNIIEMYDVFETSTFIFLVFEICRQGELFDYLTSVVCLSEKRTRIFMRQLLGAVQFFHEKNIVHRDLKPENILLDDELNIKVSDFGFATVVNKGQELTELCGTPGYLAPEVLAHSMYENVSGYGKEVDMWACGVIMYTLLCGAPPFWNRRQMMMLRAIMNADYSFNSPEWDDISDDPKNLIQKLLVVNPKERLTAREALAHPFFESKIQERKKFQARRKFRSGVFCIMFFRRLSHFYQHPPPIAMDTLTTNPYGIKFIRKVIDTCAFSMYRHWVKRVDNQNRAALFEHTLREEWKHTPVSLAHVIKTSSKPPR